MHARLQAGKEQRGAVVRVVLGLLQMAGATFSLALLIEGGVNKLSLISVAITGLLTTVSVLLFGGRGHRSNKREFEGRK